MAYHGPWENVGNQNGGGGGGSGNGSGGGGGGGGQGGGGGGIGSQELAPDLPFNADLERILSGYQSQASIAGSDAQYEKQKLFSNTFDPNNPFSSQALLKRNLAQAHAATGLQFGGSGHLYSGALEKAQSNVAFQGQSLQDQLLRGYLDSMHGIDTGLRDTVSAAQMGSEQAIFAATQDAAADWESAIPQVPPKRRNHRHGGN